MSFQIAAHTANYFQFTIIDAPWFSVLHFSPGCVVPPSPGLLIFRPFRA